MLPRSRIAPGLDWKALMLPIHSRFVVLAVLLLVPGGVIRGQNRRLPERIIRSAASALPAQSDKTRGFRETIISPDGKRVAWVESLRGKDGGPSSHSAIFVANLGDSEAK